MSSPHTHTPHPSASAHGHVGRAAATASESPAEPALTPHTLIANPPLTLFALDRSGIIRAFDGRSRESFGVESERIVGRYAMDLFGSAAVTQDGAQAMSGAQAVRRALSGETIRGQLDMADGAFQFRLLPDIENGEVVGVAGVAIEITGRVRTEKSLRALLDVMPDLVFVHRNGRVVYVNPVATEALAVTTADEVIGRPFQDLIHPDDRRAVAARIGFDEGEANEPPKARRVRLLRSDGQVRTIEKLSIPILFEAALATASIATDVTERDEARERLLLADRLAAIGTLAAGAAHEINNPLTYAMINTDHVLRQLRIVVSEKRSTVNEVDLTEHLPQLIESLVQAVDGMTRIREIVRNLMTFSRGTVESRSLVDVRSVVESSIQMALHEVVHRARLVRDLGEVPPVEANEARLGQVFLNLIVNAAQAIPEGDTTKHEVRIATRTDEAGNAVIEVGDTGVGINPDVLPRIFDPFFTSKGPGQGVGLGLSISLGTVKALGGDIHVSSEPHRGTIFRVVLPSAKGWRAAHAAPTSEDEAAERKKVLVVDDDRLVGEALGRALASIANVEVTTDARSAIDRLASGERWDVILCDLLMPGTAGMDLYREALRVAPDAVACIVFMTAGAFTSRARAFLEGVHNPCLEKPLDMAKLR
ncbi:MAG: ATP-binding protein, partial [Myxococcota bacterium]|nr:ATP-binding protein [Myxococcota bacterium]